MHPFGLRHFLNEMQWPTEEAEWKQVNLCTSPIFLRVYRFSHDWGVYFFLLTLHVFFCQWNFLGFWARRHFHCFYRNLFSFIRMDWMGSLYFNADPFCQSSSWKGYSFCHHLWLCSQPLWCLLAKETLLHNWWRGRLHRLLLSVDVELQVSHC